ncbi:hypothetical protein FQR65_LT20640 [Abscondita terminalis]|nr:hypothetical protein FQR65_LT20640 [Abscondita terminalis]
MPGTDRKTLRIDGSETFDVLGARTPRAFGSLTFVITGATASGSSPDPYDKQIDGMGGATSMHQQAVLVSRSLKADHDVDYLFGQVSIDQPFVDWSGNCGTICRGFRFRRLRPSAPAGWWMPAAPRDGVAVVRIWQANIVRPSSPQCADPPGRGPRKPGISNWTAVTFPAAEVRWIHRASGGEEGRGRLAVPHRQSAGRVGGVLAWAPSGDVDPMPGCNHFSQRVCATSAISGS